MNTSRNQGARRCRGNGRAPISTLPATSAAAPTPETRSTRSASSTGRRRRRHRWRAPSPRSARARSRAGNARARDSTTWCHRESAGNRADQAEGGSDRGGARAGDRQGRRSGPASSLPLASSVALTVQVRAPSGVCWENRTIRRAWRRTSREAQGTLAAGRHGRESGSHERAPRAPLCGCHRRCTPHWRASRLPPRRGSAERSPRRRRSRRRLGEIASGKHTLMLAPTGSGKTLAAFLWCARPAGREPRPARAGAPRRLRLADQGARLRRRAQPARAAGRPPSAAAAGRRPNHGRRPHRRHAGQGARAPAQAPPDILITTPGVAVPPARRRSRERCARSTRSSSTRSTRSPRPSAASTSRSRSSGSRTCAAPAAPNRSGSACRRPNVHLRRWLDIWAGTAGRDRRARRPPRSISESCVPAPATWPAAARAEPQRGGAMSAADLPAAARADPRAPLDDHLRQLARLAERVAQRARPSSPARPRSSCARTTARSRAHQRLEIEEALKAGRLRAIAATSSLELGIDMGAVDLVLQVESPGAVSRGLQRIGRAGHQVGGTSIGRIFPKFRGDLLEAPSSRAACSTARSRRSACPKRARRARAADRRDGRRSTTGRSPSSSA